MKIRKKTMIINNQEERKRIIDLEFSSVKREEQETHLNKIKWNELEMAN